MSAALNFVGWFLTVAFGIIAGMFGRLLVLRLGLTRYSPMAVPFAVSAFAIGVVKLFRMFWGQVVQALREPGK